MAQRAIVQNVKSVKAYQKGIEAETQKLAEFSKQMVSSVKLLRTKSKALTAKFKMAAKDIKEAALKMREEGAKQMTAKVNKFKGEIKSQIKEHAEAALRAKEACKYFQNEIGEKQADFHSYTKAFWG